MAATIRRIRTKWVPLEILFRELLVVLSTDTMPFLGREQSNVVYIQDAGLQPSKNGTKNVKDGSRFCFFPEGGLYKET